MLHNASKARCYIASLESPLLHGNIFNLTKPKYHFDTYFTKPKYYFWHLFYKAQILFWHFFFKAQILFLAPILQSLILFWDSFYKAQMLFLAPILQNPNISFGNYSWSPIILWHLFIRAQILFWQKQLHYAQKPKTISWQKHILIYWSL